MSATYLGNIESGRLPPPREDKVVALAKALKQDPNNLLARAGMVPKDVRQIMGGNPQDWNNFIRLSADLGAEGLAAEWPNLLEQVQHAVGVRGGSKRSSGSLPVSWNVAEGAVVDVLNLLTQELREGLLHGAFDIRVTCDERKGGRREVAVRAGRIYRFSITEGEAQAFASDQEQQ